jgi:acyl-coenzyme A thioesterase PaaI-like protein
VIRFLRKLIPGPFFFRLMSFYPPYWGAGVKVVEVAPDYRRIRVELKLRFWNRNYVGVQFGGSLYAMADPFYMLMMMENLGPEYIVWDKAAMIRFKRPGRGKVIGIFEIDEERIQAIRTEVIRDGKSHPVFIGVLKDEAGEVIAEVEKTLSIRPRIRSPGT